MNKQKKIIDERPEDKAWEADHVDNCLKAHKEVIDGQYLDVKYRIVGKKKTTTGRMREIKNHKIQ